MYVDTPTWGGLPPQCRVQTGKWGDARAALAGSDVSRGPRDVSTTHGPGGPVAPDIVVTGKVGGKKKTPSALLDPSVSRTWSMFATARWLRAWLRRPRDRKRRLPSPVLVVQLRGPRYTTSLVHKLIYTELGETLGKKRN